MPKDIYLVLPGGGTKGIFQLGFMQYLFTRHKDKFNIKKVFGTSVGSLLAPFVLADRLDDAIKIVNNISHPRDVYVYHNRELDFLPIWALFPFYVATYLGAFKKIRTDYIKTMMNRLPPEKKRIVFKNFCTNATNVNTGRQVDFCDFDSTGQMLKAIEASCAQPSVVVPVKINGDTYLDGAIIEQYPVTKCIDILKADILKNETDPKNAVILILDFDENPGDSLVDLDTKNNIMWYLTRLINVSISSNTRCEYALFTRMAKELDVQIKRYTMTNVKFKNNFDYNRCSKHKALHEGKKKAQQFAKEVL